jgi:hypothetical protein
MQYYTKIMDKNKESLAKRTKLTKFIWHRMLVMKHPRYIKKVIFQTEGKENMSFNKWPVLLTIMQQDNSDASS